MEDRCRGDAAVNTGTTARDGRDVPVFVVMEKHDLSMKETPHIRGWKVATSGGVKGEH